jgi:hypothetical protein
MMQMWNGAGYIVPIVAFSLLYNIIKFLELETLHIRKMLLVIYIPICRPKYSKEIKAGGKVTAQLLIWGQCHEMKRANSVAYLMEFLTSLRRESVRYSALGFFSLYR